MVSKDTEFLFHLIILYVSNFAWRGLSQLGSFRHIHSQMSYKKSYKLNDHHYVFVVGLRLPYVSWFNMGTRSAIFQTRSTKGRLSFDHQKWEASSKTIPNSIDLGHEKKKKRKKDRFLHTARSSLDAKYSTQQNNWRRDIIPRGGGRPVTFVNLGETMFLSDATTPWKRPRFCPSKPTKDHKFSSSNHSNLPTPTPNLLSTPAEK